MQQVSLIGKIIGTPEEIASPGRKVLRFRVRAENSPLDRERSASDFTVTTGKMSLRNSLSPGTEVYVSGLLAIRGTEASVQALVTHVLGRGEKSIEQAAMELIGGGIPLQGI